MPLRILLVEDEADLASSIQTVLQRQGHVVDHCPGGLEGWTLLSGELARYELAIFDWMLPDLSGLELCRRARAAGLGLPLLLLTARSDTADRVEGLDAGADDYLASPSRWRSCWLGSGRCSAAIPHTGSRCWSRAATAWITPQDSCWCPRQAGK